MARQERLVPGRHRNIPDVEPQALVVRRGASAKVDGTPNSGSGSCLVVVVQGHDPRSAQRRRGRLKGPEPLAEHGPVRLGHEGPHLLPQRHAVLRLKKTPKDIAFGTFPVETPPNGV
jgi:hypothetical protein